MSYTKTVWVNNGAPDINAENLNHMEQGIYDAHTQVDNKINAPSGGSTGQVLTKTANDVEWSTAPVSSVNGQTGAVVISTATTSADGLLSATDKGRLDALYEDYSSAMTALGV